MKKRSIILFLIALFITQKPLLGDLKDTLCERIVDQSGLTIATPSLAKREVRKLRLENGLEILLISDPETHESAAAMAVEVGSWDDPDDRPGMAHFVEHLLFLGTEKYPEEEGYTRYLDEHGGNRNAFTMADRTVYMFTVNNEGFSEALDRFGQFFISPLFNPSGVERECKAIHQEYCKDLTSDAWRALFVKKELANKSHPFHNFCIGNRETLAKISQEELRAWYQEHYSANLMHLVVLSSKTLDDLEKEVSTLFATVPNKEKQPSQLSEPLFTQGQLPQLCITTPIQDVHALELCWEIPRFYGQDRLTHADKLLSHVLGHEGETSLLAQLKRENLAERLSMGNFRAGKDQCLLTLNIQLTNQGVAEYEKVIARCFEAISTIRQSGIPRYIFDELCSTNEINYRFQSREELFEFVADYATQLIDEPLETFPRQTLIATHYEPQKVSELINVLTPQTCQYTLMASPEATRVKTTHQEQWMGVDYTLLPINKEKIAAWSLAVSHPAISIPRPNRFLPDNLSVKGDVVKEGLLLPSPTLLVEDSFGKIYAAQDTQFLVPEICWIFTIKTPVIQDSSPQTHALADLFCHALQEKLNTTAYEALSAGLHFSLKPKSESLELKIWGYSDKAYLLLKTIVSSMAHLVTTEQEFALYKDFLSREYSNTLSVSPIKKGSDLLWTVLYQDFSGLEKKNKTLKELSVVQLQTFSQQLFQRCWIEGLLYGNLEKQQAEPCWALVKETLSPSLPYPPEEHFKIKLASLPHNEHPAYITIESEQPANALILTADCGPFSFKSRAAQEILTKGLEEPFFSELRTKQQTAYLVTNWSQEIERHLYNFFAIQSSSHDTRDLLARFELFFENSLQHLQDQVIPSERFESIRLSLIEQLKHPAETISKMGSLLHQIAYQYDGDFEWLDKRMKGLQELTYEEFIKYAHQFLGKENPRRFAICVQGELPQGEHLTYRSIPHIDQLRQEICYD